MVNLRRFGEGWRECPIYRVDNTRVTSSDKETFLLTSYTDVVAAVHHHFSVRRNCCFPHAFRNKLLQKATDNLTVVLSYKVNHATTVVIYNHFLMLRYLAQVPHATYCPPENCLEEMFVAVLISRYLRLINSKHIFDNIDWLTDIF